MTRDYDEFDSMAEDLANQDKLDRKVFWQNLQHPSCQDPDHAGCEDCLENEDE